MSSFYGMFADLAKLSVTRAPGDPAMMDLLPLDINELSCIDTVF